MSGCSWRISASAVGASLVDTKLLNPSSSSSRRRILMFIASSSTIIIFDCLSRVVLGSLLSGSGGTAAAKDGNGGHAVLASSVNVTRYTPWQWVDCGLSVADAGRR